MGIRWLFALIVSLACVAALAADPGEITFWESVRDTRNPAELEAYLQAFPNGVFVPLARARLAALRGKPAAQPAPAAATPPAPAAAATASNIASNARTPQVGDVWTYRQSFPRLRGQFGVTLPPPSTHVVRVEATEPGRVVDVVTPEGRPPVRATHEVASKYVASQGASVFSPYLLAFQDAPAGRLGSVESLDGPCGKNYRCEASARVIGKETITVPAGRFETIKVLVEQEWAPFTAFSTTGSSASDMNGGRKLTVWYSPQLRRAVKYQSRLISGVIPPMDANFDLELVSYQLK